MAKISGAVKALIKRLEKGDTHTSKKVPLSEQHPQIYDQAVQVLEARKQRKEAKAKADEVRSQS